MSRRLNPVPDVDGTELGGLIDDLRGIHPGLDLMLDGVLLLALDRLTTDQTQTLCAALAGSTDGTDALTAIGLLVARISHPDTNPCLRALDEEQQKEAALHGERLVFDLAHPDLHQHASEAAAAIDSGN